MSLESYITSELNVHDLILTSDEEKYGVEYKVIADWPVLGKKLNKDAWKIKNALPWVTSAQVKSFLKNGEIEIVGVKIVAGDLIVVRGLAQTESTNYMETNTDNDVLTILDTAMYSELESEGLAREIINRVQRLRKKAGLVPTDDIRMEYKVLNDPIGLEQVFKEHSPMFEKALRRPLDEAVITLKEPLHMIADVDNVIWEEEQEIRQARFLLRLLQLF
jgi:isoleucyl-tRNA synthetase